MADALSFTGEIRMLIDGELVEADSGKRFENVNPATEEVLGEVADASAAEMQRAIVAARRAFDDTDWATDRALRKRCLEQLQEALESEREELRHELVAEVGTPVMLTYAAQLDGPLEDGLRYPAKMIDEFAWERARSRTAWHSASAAGARSGRSRSEWSARSCRGTTRSRSRSTRSARSLPRATPPC